MRVYNFHKLACIGWRIDRQVTNKIRSIVILPDLITRRREKGKQYEMIGIGIPVRLHHGPPLLEFTQRRRMEPSHRPTRNLCLK